MRYGILIIFVYFVLFTTYLRLQANIASEYSNKEIYEQSIIVTEFCMRDNIYYKCSYHKNSPWITYSNEVQFRHRTFGNHPFIEHDGPAYDTVYLETLENYANLIFVTLILSIIALILSTLIFYILKVLSVFYSPLTRG